MVAVNNEGVNKKLYEWDIRSISGNDKTGAAAESGAKIALNPGIWRIDVTINEEPFTSFVVEAN
jgi:hypothetical protein